MPFKLNAANMFHRRKHPKGGPGATTQSPHPLGAFGKLPVEIRIMIWFHLEHMLYPGEAHRVLQKVCMTLRQECQSIFFKDRVITMDFSSYEWRPGHWPSEFTIHDQYGNWWTVSPQFDQGYCTFDRGKNLSDLAWLGQREGAMVRIVIGCPKDAGEMLQAWNRVQWAASFLRHCRANLVRIVCRPLTGTSFPEPYPAASLPRGVPPRQEWTQVEAFHFILNPLSCWITELTSCTIEDDSGCINLALLGTDLVGYRYGVRGYFYEHFEKEGCQNWASHYLDELDMPSADRLRLEQMASIDAQLDKSGALADCEKCCTRRSVTSAWAPQQRDLKLRRIHSEKEHRRRSDCPTKKAQRAGQCRRMAQVNAIQRANDRYEYSCRDTEMSWAEWRRALRDGNRYGRYNGGYHVYCSMELRRNHFNESGDKEVTAAFNAAVRTIEDHNYGWPKKVQQLEEYWSGLHHWLTEHPTGIPHWRSETSSKLLDEFKYRHVMHPPEFCKCKGVGWAGIYKGPHCGRCNVGRIDYRNARETDDESEY